MLGYNAPHEPNIKTVRYGFSLSWRGVKLKSELGNLCQISYEQEEVSDMKKPGSRFNTSVLVACIALIPVTGAAQESTSEMDYGLSEGEQMSMSSDGEGGMRMDMMRADSHAPFGVMGGDRMRKGMWMFSYGYMRMEMEDNLVGTDNVSPEQIVTTVPNRFFGLTGQPPTLRVVATEMTTDMHMFGAMYAPTEQLTLMGMVPYTDRSMKHVTFKGPTGTTRLGTFTTKSSGIGDVKLMGLFRIRESKIQRVHVNVGLSLPTGSINEKDDILTPTGARPTQRLPYPMQLGSGTFDLIPGITYKGGSGGVGWGAQYLATIRLGDNDEDYSLGDIHQITGWGSYSWNPAVSASLRFTARTIAKVDGIDSQIVAPVQTADPDFQGGDRVDLGLGLNFSGQQGS